MDDVSQAQALAALASSGNTTQATKLITSAHSLDDGHDHDHSDDDFDNDWESFAALAASGQLNGTVGNATNAVLSFINTTLPTSTSAQALYTNISGVIQKQVQAAKAYVLPKAC